MKNIPDFNARQCIRALDRLGFRVDLSKGKGGHAKAYAPVSASVIAGQRPFVIIPIHGKFRLQNVIIKELKRMGISQEGFIRALKK